MIKKEYIQPEAKEVELKLTTILAGSIQGSNGNSFNEDDAFDTDEGDGSDAL